MRDRVSDAKVAWRVTDGEAVLLQADTSAYFGLNRLGTLLWEELAARSQRSDDLAAWLTNRCAEAPPSISADVAAFLTQLSSHDLIEVAEEEADPRPAQSGSELPAPANVPYESPQLFAFGELEKLILSGE